ncbi:MULTISPECIES: uracil-DNA glycosylase [Actibacterium]|uniref:Type-4 uracil-DNA glycosylase n=1 Tax=Actibacterium naphthalenivorans TaxID=1614693 RepID=A0A840CC31_9RHOB|nr:MULTISPECIES: uracil-DNA glycosylase [Actibacterium]ALG91318.1 uracil-DNA glycosylase [Actibacterium sp. EMB200-NS6]MBB4022710.1 DNA polymerase [Actibacterium naphthalenivorans]
MDSALDYHTAKALLAWQVELGATEAIGEVAVNRYEAAAEPVPAAVPPVVAPVAAAEVDPVAVAKAAAAAAGDLEGLRAALEAFEFCELKKGARNLVFADGRPGAGVMVIGEAPGREEDQQGRPFVGRAGQLLDRMFAAIGMGRDAPDPGAALYITNILPWRPPQNRDPKPEEVAMMLPFVERHVELADPDLLVLMGNHSCQALLGRKGITRLRGHWMQALGRPALPMFHPAYLLRNPHAKREAWHDLLMLQAKLRGA